MVQVSSVQNKRMYMISYDLFDVMETRNMISPRDYTEIIAITRYKLH